MKISSGCLGWKRGPHKPNHRFNGQYGSSLKLMFDPWQTSLWKVVTDWIISRYKRDVLPQNGATHTKQWYAWDLLTVYYMPNVKMMIGIDFSEADAVPNLTSRVLGFILVCTNILQDIKRLQLTSESCSLAIGCRLGVLQSSFILEQVDLVLDFSLAWWHQCPMLSY